MERAFLLYPAASAVGYAFSALALKRAMGGGMGPWRINFLTNWVMFLVFVPFLLVHGLEWPDLWWPMLLSGTLFFVGQMTTYLALQKGDVSVATPVLGSKVVLVAVFLAIFIGETPGLPVWVAAFLTVAGICLLQGRGKGHATAHAAVPTIGYALASAAAFAAGDIMVQHWAPRVGFGSFMLASMLVTALLSCVMVARFQAPLWAIPRGLGLFVAVGAVLMALQSVGMAVAIGLYGHAAEVNIVYSSRGIWSIVLVWLVGGWFANTERDMGTRIFWTRMIGSGLILLAIGLVVAKG